MASAPAAPVSTRTVVAELVARHGLDLRLIAVEEISDDPEHGQITRVVYTAAQRVDFRQFVVELARALHCRIDMRQISDREACARLGSVGLCGRPICCASWIKNPEPVPVTIARRYATNQEPDRVVGACGRLMCCLRFESTNKETTVSRSPTRE